MILNFPKQVLNLIGDYFPLEVKDAGKYNSFRCGPMRVKIDWYHAQGLGNVCAMKASAPLGLMKLATLVIHPMEKDVPLFSFDYVSALGKHTLLLELYDTVHTNSLALANSLIKMSDLKSTLLALPNYDLGEHWYDELKMAPSLAKRTKKAHTTELDQASIRFLEIYLDLCTIAPPSVLGNTKVAEYVNGLFQNGGPSTDIFIKALGEDNTRQLFEKIIFNTSTSALTLLSK